MLQFRTDKSYIKYSVCFVVGLAICIAAGVTVACDSTENNSTEEVSTEYVPTEDTSIEVPRDSAKNVIVLISDGWGFNHMLSASYWEGSDSQVYEGFPISVAMSTFEDEGFIGASRVGSYDPDLMWTDFRYCSYPATDSAAAATAMSTGFKTYSGSIGWGIDGEPLKHAAQYAEEAGKATGVVTSVELSHATPAGFVAHNASRSNYAKIANEMIYDSATDVIMGCGAPDYDNDGAWDGGTGVQYTGGKATWTDIKDGTVYSNGRRTVDDADGDLEPDPWTVIRDRAEFQAMGEGETPARVLGIPKVYTTLQQRRSGDAYADPYVVPLTQNVPTLAEMSAAALNVLDDDDEGFFLMIEGGAVDWASHAGQSGRMIEEQIDFNKAVEAVVRWVEKNSDWDETLVIVTGDHECGYLWGPGSGGRSNGKGTKPIWKPIVDNGAGNLPGMQWNRPLGANQYGHTNQLVPFFAKGGVARLLEDYADEIDPVRGRYLDNTDMGKVLIDVVQ